MDPTLALALGEIAKASLRAYVLSCEQAGITKNEALAELEREYEAFKPRDPDLIPDPE